MNAPTNGNGGNGFGGLEPKKLAIIGGGLLLGWALLENAYRDGLRTGLMLAARNGDISMRDIHGYGFPFGPWLLIAAVVGFVGWRKGWWGNRHAGPHGANWHRMTPPPQPPPPAPTRVPVTVAPSEWSEGPRQAPPAPPANENPTPQGPRPSAPPPTDPGLGPVI